MIKRRVYFGLFRALAGSLVLVGSAGAAPLRKSDRRYLAGVYQDTWLCLAHFVSPKTGLPYDSSRRAPATSTTNIGFYLASCAVAGRTGLLPPEEARKRLDAALTSLEKIQKFLGGFPVTWVNAETLQSTENKFSTADHLSNLTASLLVVKGIVPDLAARIDKILTPMDWGDLYEPSQGWYKGGWRLDKKDFDVHQKGWDWYYSFLGADTRFGVVWGIGTGQIPPESWPALNRKQETKYGFSYFLPGWQGGGLFMQYVTGLFIDERDTPIGKSAANFAWAQMAHADRIGAPVWGWSSSESPNGKEYLGWGDISDNVVTPHAAGLAALYYPRRAIENLRQFQKRGARAPFKENGRSFAFGFRDSYDWKSGQVSETYLCVDQALMFLSLANLLHEGILWKAVAVDPHVQRARREISDYAATDDTLLPLYKERDGIPTTKKSRGALK
ncbi:MAG: DUF3131 domain-containing protein [Elusimicrobia bacterium]|jgi:hypothetical protein|nr:DUF3131 domain-containing protein [Elusimicrobiota bacterium]